MADIGSFGQVFQGWTLGRELGHGAFGAVYEATRRDELARMEQKAAVKWIRIPRDDQADDLRGFSSESRRKLLRSQLDSLVQEIKSMDALKGHRNLVSYEDHRVIERPNGEGYDVFLRMELLTTLTNYARQRNGLSLQEIVRLGIDIAAALEAMQEEGYIHRDVKPANVFIDRHGNFKLGDFGTARAMQAGGAASTFAGSLAYMAPEVAQNSQSYGCTVDHYSLGVMLYRYLNRGWFPFQSEQQPDVNAAITARNSGMPIAPPRDADPRLAAIVLKCLAYQPQARWQTAAQLRRALEDYRDSLRNGPGGGNGFVDGGFHTDSVSGGGGTTQSYRGGSVRPPVGGTTPQYDVGGGSVRPPVGGGQPGPSGGSDPHRPKKRIGLIAALIAVVAVAVACVVYFVTRPGPTPTPTAAPALDLSYITSLWSKTDDSFVKDLGTSAKVSELGSGEHMTPLLSIQNNAKETATFTVTVEVDGDRYNYTGEFTVDSDESFNFELDSSQAERYYTVGQHTAAWFVNGERVATFTWTVEEETASQVNESTEESKIAFSSVKVGEYITFGHYPQTSSGTDSTAIEWLVLDVQDGKALIISKYALDSKPYNTEYTSVTWETCTLRNWLNKDFLLMAFTSAEQDAILTTTVNNSSSQGLWGTNGGNNTQDKVFLLSYKEASTYFSSDDARMCAPTDYAIAQGAWASDDYKVNGRGTGLWWLRSPGQSSASACPIFSLGGFGTYSHAVNLASDVVRPAFWLNLSSAGIY